MPKKAVLKEDLKPEENAQVTEEPKKKAPREVKGKKKEPVSENIDTSVHEKTEKKSAPLARKRKPAARGENLANAEPAQLTEKESIKQSHADAVSSTAVNEIQTSENEPFAEANTQAEVSSEVITETLSSEIDTVLPEVINSPELDTAITETISDSEVKEVRAVIHEPAKIIEQSELSEHVFHEAEEEYEEETEEERDDSIDYSPLSKEELIGILREILQSEYTPGVKNNIENIKLNFYKKHRTEIDEKRRKFIEDGGLPEHFKTDTDPVESEFKDLYNVYKSLRTGFNEKVEAEKYENLKNKYQIIEEIKELTNKQESINKTFNEFRELQRKWRETGLVPQSEMKNLWETYHYHVEKFYDYVKINRELRDLDLKKNLEEKIRLCDKAEELLLETNVLKAFKALQKYHDQWREIGPVPMEKKEEIWERFKEASNKINKKHQEYFDNIRREQENNLQAKTLLCEKTEEIVEQVSGNHKDWEKFSREIIELQKLWKTIGFATRKENTRIYERFRNACDSFFGAKRNFYDENKEEQNNNLQSKTDLCIQAESLKDSTDWKKTTEDFIRLQEKWKTIGPVPRKHSDIIWKRFRSACNYFFEEKEKHFANIDQQYEENLKKKLELIEKVEKFEQQENTDTLEMLKNFQKEWMEIGHVPIKMKDRIQKQFRDAINKQFDNLKIDEVKRTVFLYKQKLETISQPSRNSKQLKIEKDKILSTIKQLETDIALLENNIGFFAKTKNAESLINDVNARIEKAKKNIIIEKQKLDMIHKIENQKTVKA
jgi:hypothetical protein